MLQVNRIKNWGGVKYILAVKCDYQQYGILTSVDSDEFVQPPLKFLTPNDAQSVA